MHQLLGGMLWSIKVKYLHFWANFCMNLEEITLREGEYSPEFELIPSLQFHFICRLKFLNPKLPKSWLRWKLKCDLKKTSVPIFSDLESAIELTSRAFLLGWHHGLRTPNEGINQRNLKIWADVVDKIFFGCT